MSHKKTAAFIEAALNPLGVTKDNGDVYEDLQIKAFAFTANVIRMLSESGCTANEAAMILGLTPCRRPVSWATLEEELTLNILQLYQHGNAMRMEVIRCDR